MPVLDKHLRGEEDDDEEGESDGDGEDEGDSEFEEEVYEGVGGVGAGVVGSFQEDTATDEEGGYDE